MSHSCLVAVIIKQSGWVFASASIAVGWCADEISEAVYDIMNRKIGGLSVGRIQVSD